jgi:hypothetical protein
MTLEELYSEALLSGSTSHLPPQTFELYESVKGRRLNTLEGLALHREVLSPAEQQQTLHYVRRLRDLGDDGALMGRTYSAPRKWMKGKGRVTVQMGCCYNYARDKAGNPPGILPREPVCGMPRFFEDIVDRMCERGIFDSDTRPGESPPPPGPPSAFRTFLTSVGSACTTLSHTFPNRPFFDGRRRHSRFARARRRQIHASSTSTPKATASRRTLTTSTSHGPS